MECCGTCGRVGRRSGTRADGRLDLECPSFAVQIPEPWSITRPAPMRLRLAPTGASDRPRTLADHSRLLLRFFPSLTTTSLIRRPHTRCCMSSPTLSRRRCITLDVSHASELAQRRNHARLALLLCTAGDCQAQEGCSLGLLAVRYTFSPIHISVPR